jgi:tetratricopeptide (TPR) repeat protein
MAAEMRNNLSVALLQASRFDQALQAVEGTPQIFLEAEDTHRAAMSFGNLASALEATGDLQAAEHSLQSAIQLFQETGDKENLMHSAKALSQVQLRMGKPLEAVSSMQGGLAGQSKLSLKNRVLRSILNLPSRIMGR